MGLIRQIGRTADLDRVAARRVRRRDAPNQIRCTIQHQKIGEVPEWSNGPDSKSGVRFSRTVGSNPTLSAKTIKTAPLWGRLYFTCRVWLRTRALFDQRSSDAACWRGAREASESIPPSPPINQQRPQIVVQRTLAAIFERPVASYGRLVKKYALWL